MDGQHLGCRGTLYHETHGRKSSPLVPHPRNVVTNPMSTRYVGRRVESGTCPSGGHFPRKKGDLNLQSSYGTLVFRLYVCTESVEPSPPGRREPVVHSQPDRQSIWVSRSERGGWRVTWGSRSPWGHAEVHSSGLALYDPRRSRGDG